MGKFLEGRVEVGNDVISWIYGVLEYPIRAHVILAEIEIVIERYK